jgi:hypothetical protein
VNDDGNPVHLFVRDEEGGETLSIEEKSLKGPLASVFDRNLVVDIIISTTGATRCLADVIADYTIPSVYLFKHIIQRRVMPPRRSDGAWWEEEIASSSLLAAPGDAVPSPEFAKTHLANAVRQSSKIRLCVGDKDVWAVVVSILRATSKNELQTIIDSLQGIRSVTGATSKTNGALVKIHIAYNNDKMGEICSEKFVFCAVAGGGYKQTILE